MRAVKAVQRIFWSAFGPSASWETLLPIGAAFGGYLRMTDRIL
jgi:hypothetical protein